jgi:GNAT superfamily N-acetyltransferase
MTSLLRIKYLQFLEHCQDKGFWSACRMTLYKFEEAVPVEKDLTTLRPVKAPPGQPPQLVDLGPENFRALDLHYPQPSRKERAERNFRLGYRSLAMVRDKEVLGDLWYVTRSTAQSERIHPHVQWFRLELGPQDIYMFDMHVNAKERGSALATWFLGSVLHALRDRGMARAYGYFDAHNVPALWVHRLIGYRELSHHIVRRYFLYETVRQKA